jgi:putative transposase
MRPSKRKWTKRANASRAVVTPAPTAGAGRRVAIRAGLSFKMAWRLPLALRLPAGQTTGWRIGHFQLEKPRLRRRQRAGSDPRPERAERPNHVWTYDLLHDQRADGQRIKPLSVLDEFTRECLAIHVGQSIRAQPVTRVLADVIATRGAPAFVHSDNGSEVTATAVMAWLRDQQVGPAFIAPGRPWHGSAVVTAKASTAAVVTRASTAKGSSLAPRPRR